jgi:hypothetical protein
MFATKKLESLLTKNPIKRGMARDWMTKESALAWRNSGMDDLSIKYMKTSQKPAASRRSETTIPHGENPTVSNKAAETTDALTSILETAIALCPVCQ